MDGMYKFLIWLFFDVFFVAFLVALVIFFSYGSNGVAEAIITLESYVGLFGLALGSMLVTIGIVRLVGKYLIKV